MYGTDGRTELHEVAERGLRDLAAERAVAIMRPESLAMAADAVSIDAPPLGEVYGLCPGQRFEAQPTAAVCSGILVDRQTVLTAGHCLRGMFCDEMRLVFGYVNRTDDTLATIRSKDVFSCKAVLASELTPSTKVQRRDYAWLQLDRPVPGIDAALPFRKASDGLEVGEPVTLVGFSGGTPLKIDQTGSIIDPRDETMDYFLTTADSFDGNSGSAVLDEQRRIVGVQGRGGTDYWPSDAGCNEVVGEQDDGSTASVQATYAGRALEGLCKAKPTHELCCRIGGTCARVASDGGCDASGSSGTQVRSRAASWIMATILTFAAARVRRIPRRTTSRSDLEARETPAPPRRS